MYLLFIEFECTV